MRKLTIAVLTGPAGRFTAFAVDISVAMARHWGRRAAGKESPW